MKALIAAVSLLALAATPALAQGNGNGGGNGQGNGNRGGGAAAAQAGPQERGNGRDNGNARRENGGNRAAQPDRGQDHSAHSPRANNGNGNAGNNDRGGPAARSADRGPAVSRGNGQDRAGNRAERDVRRVERGNGNDRADRDRGANDVRRAVRREGPLVERVLYRDTGLVNGCPPGLAAKRNGCTPPGQLRQQDDRYARYSRYAPNWWGLPYRGGSTFYDDGYLLRYDGNRITGYIPLLGGALAVGNAWPVDYGYDRVPDYYSRYYGLGGNYRYADNVIYRVDPETAMIASVAALLTGDEFVVGQPLPRGYDVYNVPYSYRDRYRDGPDGYYRYSDGYVYRIDPETQLIAAAIELLI